MLTLQCKAVSQALSHRLARYISPPLRKPWFLAASCVSGNFSCSGGNGLKHGKDISREATCRSLRRPGDLSQQQWGDGGGWVMDVQMHTHTCPHAYTCVHTHLFIDILHFEIGSTLQKSCENSTKDDCTAFTRIPSSLHFTALAPFLSRERRVDPLLLNTAVYTPSPKTRVLLCYYHTPLPARK